MLALDDGQKMGVPGFTPFVESDELWKSFQNGIKNFVTSHSGNASVNMEQTFRPNWKKVKAVIDGTQPLSTLSKNCL